MNLHQIRNVDYELNFKGKNEILGAEKKKRLV
jgi:hypothetical protein